VVFGIEQDTLLLRTSHTTPVISCPLGLFAAYLPEMFQPSTGEGPNKIPFFFLFLKFNQETSKIQKQ
jgi:hypothetical protein